MKAKKKARKRLYRRISELSGTASDAEDITKLAEAYAKITFGAYGVQEQNITNKHLTTQRKGAGFS